jgi:predicted nuclease with TOPRIM domain
MIEFNPDSEYVTWIHFWALIFTALILTSPFWYRVVKTIQGHNDLKEDVEEWKQRVQETDQENRTLNSTLSSLNATLTGINSTLVGIDKTLTDHKKWMAKLDRQHIELLKQVNGGKGG